MKTVLCFGDSNTWGYDPKSNSRFSSEIRWTELIWKRLGNGYKVIEEGMCGRTTEFYNMSEDYVSGLNALPYIIRSQYPIDLILVMLGTNDTKEQYGITAQEISKGLKHIIMFLKNKKLWEELNTKQPKVLIVAPTHIINISSSPFYKEFGKCAEQKIFQLGKYFKEVAIETECYFVDASLYAIPGVYDGIHLDKNGHKILSEVFYEKIRQLMEE